VFTPSKTRTPYFLTSALGDAAAAGMRALLRCPSCRQVRRQSVNERVVDHEWPPGCSAAAVVFRRDLTATGAYPAAGKGQQAT